MKRLYTDTYERGNDYDQAELFSDSPCGAYVTIQMLNAIVSKLIILISKKQEKLDLGYIEYDNDKYLHDVNEKNLFAEVANKAINDENGDNINDTYLKKADQTYQYNEFDEIVGINNSAIAAGQGSKRLIGEDGIYVRDDLTANIIGVSANYAYSSALSGYQTKLTDEQMQDINSIPFKLDKAEFAELSANELATKEYVQDEIAEIGTPLVIRGSKTCSEIEEIDDPKIGDVYCVEDTGVIHQPDYEDLNVNEKDEVAFTSDNGWIVIGREVAVDLSDYYKKNETSGAGEISAAIDAIDQQFTGYYPMSATSGAAQISAALENKVGMDTLDNYYLKTDTSSKDELNTALGNKANVSSLTAYVTNTDLATNYYDKTETSSKEQISAALNDKANKSDLDLYYTMAETSGADELSSAFDEKLDKTFSSNFYPMTGNPSGFLTEHQSLEGLMAYSGLGIVDGKITGYSGIPFAGQGGNPFTGDVQGALDEVYTNSSIWLTAHQDLSNYATLDDIASKVDTSSLSEILDYYVTNDTLTSNYYTTAEVDSAFGDVISSVNEKVDYSYLQDNYYNIYDTSSKEEISDALDEKLDKTDFETSGAYWNETTITVNENSAAWSQGNSAVNDLVTANSGTWNNVSSKLDTTAFSMVSGDFLTAHQDLSYISGKIDEKLDSTAFNPEDFYPSNNPSGFITGVDLSNYYTTAQTYNRNELYTRTEVDSLMDGKIVVVTALPATGKNSVIYYVGPNPDVSGYDKYDEFIWDKTNSDWIQVGEHSLDLSGYATEDDVAAVYEYVGEVLGDKLDTSAIQGINNTITAINGSAIKDTTYTPGANIDITNNTISGKDWSTEINSAVSGKADSSDVEDLTEQMIENFSQLDEDKLDISAFNESIAAIEDEFTNVYETIDDKLDTSAFSDVSGTFLTAHQSLSAYLTKSSADTLYQPIGDYATNTQLDEKLDIEDFVDAMSSISSTFDDAYETIDEIIDELGTKQDALTNEQLSAISSVSSIKGTVITGDSNIRATSAEEGNNIKWTLELTAQPVVTDTTLSGYRGVVAAKDSTVSSQWNVGLAEPVYNIISSVSSIPTITKSDVDEIWAIVTAERGQ